MATLQAHALAKMFPAIPPEEFKHIVADVKAKGCFEPIWTYEGKVLDGWHRYQACQKAGVKPKFREYAGKDARGFVVSMNIMRRHLGAEARAAFVALAAKKAGTLVRATDGEREPSGDDRRMQVRTSDVQKEANVSDNTAKAAVRVADERPDLSEKVIAGEMSLSAADAVVAGAGERNRKAAKAGKKEKQKHEEQPREVKQFLEAVRQFTEKVDAAVGVVKFGKFSPEAARFTARKLNALSEKIARLSAMLEEVQ